MDPVLYAALSKKDAALLQYFSWAGSNFPFNSDSANITISAPTTWDDAVGYKKVGKLTINAGQTLTIQKSPFYIFADEIAFGDTDSTIDASGLSGSATPTTFPTTQANGATAQSGSALSQGGCGGGMLLILCNRITGANGIIKADGGNGYSNTTNASGDTFKGGQGALSSTINNGGGGESFILAVNGALTSSTATLLCSTLNLLGDGGGGNPRASGGGSGQGSAVSFVGGGSGIAGGGGAAAVENGFTATITPMPLDLIQLAQIKCRGGGGGAALVSTTGTGNICAGGGGGAILVFTHTTTATPTLQANGGTGTVSGAAGVTYLITL
jgi:hypothetical protein